MFEKHLSQHLEDHFVIRDRPSTRCFPTFEVLALTPFFVIFSKMLALKVTEIAKKEAQQGKMQSHSLI